MSKTSFNIRMDDNMKRDAEHLFAEMGLTITGAINIFIKQSLNEGGLPFKPTTISEFDRKIMEMDSIKLRNSKGACVLPKEWDVPEDSVYDDY